MNSLWYKLEDKKFREQICLTINICISAILGLITGFFVTIFFPNLLTSTLIYFICIGYFIMIFGFIGGLIFIYRKLWIHKKCPHGHFLFTTYSKYFILYFCILMITFYRENNPFGYISCMISNTFKILCYHKQVCCLLAIFSIQAY